MITWKEILESYVESSSKLMEEAANYNLSERYALLKEVHQRILDLQTRVEELTNKGYRIYSKFDNDILYDMPKDGYYYMDRKLNLTWYPLKWHGALPYRERVTGFVFSEDLEKVIIRKPKNGKPKLMGGGTEPGLTLEETFMREVTEELFMNSKDPMYHFTVEDKAPAGKVAPVPYAGEENHYISAIYDGLSSDKVGDKELNLPVLFESEFVTIKEAKKILPTKLAKYMKACLAQRKEKMEGGNKENKKDKSHEITRANFPNGIFRTDISFNDIGTVSAIEEFSNFSKNVGGNFVLKVVPVDEKFSSLDTRKYEFKSGVIPGLALLPEIAGKHVLKNVILLVKK